MGCDKNSRVVRASGARSARRTQSTELQIATNRVVAGLARIAFADIRDLFDARGELLPFADLSPDIRPALAAYHVRHGRNGSVTVCIRFHSKLAALAALGRYRGLFATRPHRVALVPSPVVSHTQPGSAARAVPVSAGSDAPRDARPPLRRGVSRPGTVLRDTGTGKCRTLSHGERFDATPSSACV